MCRKRHRSGLCVPAGEGTSLWAEVGGSAGKSSAGRCRGSYPSHPSLAPAAVYFPRCLSDCSSSAPPLLLLRLPLLPIKPSSTPLFSTAAPHPNPSFPPLSVFPFLHSFPSPTPPLVSHLFSCFLPFFLCSSVSRSLPVNLLIAH